ncbi:MAG: hypothetical protein QXJ27_05670 [Thermoplasmata archaeon]
MRRRAREVAQTLVSLITHYNNLPFYIVSHGDADGITAATIIGTTLHAHRIQPVLIFTNSTEINELVYHGTIRPAMKNPGDEKNGIWIFTDTGSAAPNTMEKFRKKIIIDHHPGGPGASGKWGISARTINNDSWTVQFFPEIVGVEAGACTAAFLTYIVARNVMPRREHGPLAVIGSLGDRLLAKEFSISGVAREAVEEAAAADEISIKTDLVVPGKETLPLRELFIGMEQMLQMNLGADFLNQMMRELKVKEKELEERRWIELLPKEKRRFLSWFAKKRLANNQDPDTVLRMVGEVYHLKKHKPGCHLHDCAEFGKLLNECGERGLYEDAYNLCLNQTEEHYREVLRKLYLL